MTKRTEEKINHDSSDVLPRVLRRKGNQKDEERKRRERWWRMTTWRNIDMRWYLLFKTNGV